MLISKASILLKAQESSGKEAETGKKSQTDEETEEEIPKD